MAARTSRTLSQTGRSLRAALRGVPAAVLLVLLAGAAAPAPASAAVDDWTHVWEVVRLADYRQTGPVPPSGLSVYYLGDSIARESAVSDTAWTRQLRRRAQAAGKAAVFAARDLGGHNQTFGMDELILQGLPVTPPRQPRGIVLIGVGVSRFIGPPATVSPPDLRPVPPGRRPSLSAWVQHLYDTREPLSLAHKRRLAARWMERRWADFRANKAANLAAIQRLVDLARSKGLRPVLVDQPLDLRVAAPRLDRPRLAIRYACEGLARRNGIRYLHFTKALGLPSSSFWDLHHLIRPGYERWQARLSRELVKLLPEERRVR